MKHCWQLDNVRPAQGFMVGPGKLSIEYQCKTCGARFTATREKRDKTKKVTAIEWQTRGILECDVELARHLHSS